MLITERAMMVKKCKEHGEYEYEVFEFPGKKLESACPECYKIAKEKDLELVKAKREREDAEWREKSFRESGIEDRYLNCTFKSYMGHEKELHEVKRYLHRFIQNKKQTSPLFLCGKFGTGKTHLGCAMINHLITTGVCRGFYTTLRAMARDIRESRSFSNDKSEQEMVDKYVQYPFLVLDEVGLQSGTNDEKMTIFDVMNGRYNKYHPTVIISKLTYKDLVKFLGAEVMDRFKGSDGDMVVFDWESERGKHE
jgi:DNA replication protein DnaC